MERPIMKAQFIDDQRPEVRLRPGYKVLQRSDLNSDLLSFFPWFFKEITFWRGETSERYFTVEISANGKVIGRDSLSEKYAGPMGTIFERPSGAGRVIFSALVGGELTVTFTP